MAVGNNDPQDIVAGSGPAKQETKEPIRAYWETHPQTGRENEAGVFNAGQPGLAGFGGASARAPADEPEGDADND